VALRPLQSSPIREHDLESTEPRVTALKVTEVALVAWHGWSRLFTRRLQPGFGEIRGRIGFWSQSDAAPSRLLARGAGLPRSV